MTDQADNQKTARAASMANELRIVLSQLRRKTREARPGAFTDSQLHALSRLAKQGSSTVSILAAAEGIRPQSMGANIAVLEQAGLVSRAPDPADGRQSILSLTPAAESFIQEFRAAREDWLVRGIQSRLTKSEQAQLAKSLSLIRRLVD